MNEQVKILIADDHALVRKGLRQVIESDSRFKIIGEAANGKEALTLLLQQPPQIAILDVNMPELTGFEVAQALHSCKLNVAIIFLTMHKDKNYFNKAMDCGAKGYILKDGVLGEIVNALEAVMQGKPYISTALSSYLLQRLDRISLLARQTPELNTLTPTERRILKLVAEYKTSKEIAEELHIHFRTVDNHRTNITNKLALQGSHALLKFAIEHQDELA
jgi:DNA-binding NarL/FixJ family response regulator